MRMVLVHGGCHGAWCWERVLPLLPDAVAVDLPAQGDPLAAILEAIGEGPVMLVGHSLGGMAISAAAEAAPERVARLVYLSALLPLDGESAATIAVSPLGANAATRLEGEWAVLDPAVAPPIFYQDCDAATVEWALARLGGTHVGTIAAPVSLSAARFGRVTKTYVHCTQDRAIQMSAQEIMVARYPGIAMASLDSGHSPFLSMPEQLAKCLVACAGEGMN